MKSRGFTIAEFLSSARATIREHLRGIPPAQRAAAWRRSEIHETHFYAFLRGDDSALSIESLDRVLETIGIRVFVDAQGRIRPTLWRQRRAMFSRIDWKKTNVEIAVEMGMTNLQIAGARRYYHPRRSKGKNQ